MAGRRPPRRRTRSGHCCAVSVGCSTTQTKSPGVAVGQAVIMGAAHNERLRKVGRVDHGAVRCAGCRGAGVPRSATSSSPIGGRGARLEDRHAVAITPTSTWAAQRARTRRPGRRHLERAVRDRRPAHGNADRLASAHRVGRRPDQPSSASTDGTRIYYRITGRSQRRPDRALIQGAAPTRTADSLERLPPPADRGIADRQPGAGRSDKPARC